MGRIFLNYRRADSKWAMGRVFDWLVNAVGEGEVFMDLSGIPAGSDFRHHLATELNRCDLLIAGISTSWVDLLNERSGTEDHVRCEIEMAIDRGLPILPLLLGDEQELRSLKSSDLPKSLSSIARLNMSRVKPGKSFDDDMKRLLEDIQELRTTRDHPEQRIHPLGMVFQGIPATTQFARGACMDDPEAADNEMLQPPVPLPAFWLSETPITVKQYRAVMGEAEWKTIYNRYPESELFRHHTEDEKPVTHVTWFEACEFCDRLNQLVEGLNTPLPRGFIYRLPNETEWEYACRATVPNQSRYGTFPEIGWVATSDRSAPFSDVGKKKSNAWSLFDMLGLVFEWCQDGIGEKKIARGGSYDDIAKFARASTRGGFRPEKTSARIGFRVALAQQSFKS